MNKKPIIVLAALALLAACDGPNPFSSLGKPNMTPLSPKLQKLFENTKPVCFGRFVIDVPVDTKIGWGPADAPYSIVSYPGEAHRMSAEIKAKLDGYAAEKHKTEPSMLLKVQDGPSNGSKIIVGYNDNLDDTAASIDAYLRLPPHAFVITARNAIVAEEILGHKITPENRWPAVLAKISDVASRLRVRENDEIPTDPGICIESGFITEAEGKFHERIRIGFRVLPDVHFSIMSMHSNRPVVESNTLEAAERYLAKGKTNAGQRGLGAEYAKIKWLRKDRREFAEQQAFEFGGRYPESKGNAHEFKIETQGEPKNPLKPSWEITLDTGAAGDQPGKAKPSLTDEEAVALWDKLLASIRPRPTGAAKDSAKPGPTPDAAPIRLPLKSKTTSAVNCPQTGVWQCAADTPGITAHRRFIEAGQPMPYGASQRHAKGLSGFLGGKDEEAAEITWTLTAYTDDVGNG